MVTFQALFVIGTTFTRPRDHPRLRQHFVPTSAAAGVTSTGSDGQQQRQLLSDLCTLLDIEANEVVLNENDSGVRGIYHDSESSSVHEGEALLYIPLKSCLRDDSPPAWLQTSNDDVDNDYYSSEWATRLAASLLDLKLRKNGNVDNRSQLYKGKTLWLSLLPDCAFLRASLPIHWPSEILQTTKCQALELAVDSAYFGRASAVMDLVRGLKNCADLDIGEYGEDSLLTLCHDALDIVQTRTCRVMVNENATPLRVLAPVFDFLNHGTNPNAGFDVESELLVVRATRDIGPSEEVLIDYGDSAAPAWRSLVSYGFVPEFGEGDDRNTVELSVDDVRANVGGDSVPFELVEAAANYLAEKDNRVLEQGDNIFTPDVARRIAGRAAEEAKNLLDDSAVQVETEQDEYSLNLATALRRSQNKVLSSWSLGLEAFADENS